MTRMMTASREGRRTRLALAAVAAMLWVVTQGAVSASAAAASNFESDGSSASSSDARGGPGKSDAPGKGNRLPGSVRWR